MPPCSRVQETKALHAGRRRTTTSPANRASGSLPPRRRARPTSGSAQRRRCCRASGLSRRAPVGAPRPSSQRSARPVGREGRRRRGNASEAGRRASPTQRGRSAIAAGQPRVAGCPHPWPPPCPRAAARPAVGHRRPATGPLPCTPSREIGRRRGYRAAPCLRSWRLPAGATRRPARRKTRQCARSRPARPASRRFQAQPRCSWCIPA